MEDLIKKDIIEMLEEIQELRKIKLIYCYIKAMKNK